MGKIERLEKKRIYQRAYNKSEAGKQAMKRFKKTSSYTKLRTKVTKIYRNRHPLKHKAHQAVWNAVHRGNLIKLPCKKCGNPLTEGHHKDYSRKLDVIWLCSTHHHEVHAFS